MDEQIECPLAAVLSERLRDARNELIQRWLDRISARVAIDPARLFPTHEILDHIPLLIEGIADYLADPTEEISAEVPVVAKAMELGKLRHAQGFSADEILKEYEILGGVLFSFLVHTVGTIDAECSRSELLACAQRLFRAIAAIQQITTAHYLRVADEQVHDQEQRLRSFNRMVTHELRNRMAAVRGATSVLQEPWIAQDLERRKKFLSIVDRNLEGMQEVLQDLLTLSRTDGSARQHRNVLLPEAVAEAVRQLREMAEEREVEIRIAPDLPDLEVDAAAVELCLINYISNGIKYSDPAKSERWVEVRAYREADAAGELILEVTDNGIGVPAEARDRLFERFFRAHDETAIEGTGLGLSIVREAVEGLGGRAWVEFPAGENEGSVFKLALPARRAEDVEDPGSARPDAAAGIRRAGITPSAGPGTEP